MARNFFSTGFESASLGRVYSAEEEEQLIAETPAEEVEIQAEIQEADRALEVSDALEDLALVADGIDEASTTDVQLLETAVSVAAGPDVDVEEIVPALESYVGRKLSTEGLVETAKAIWENIKRWLLKIWKQVKDFFYKLFGQIPAMRRKVEALKKRVEETAGFKKEETNVTVSTGMKFMSIDGKAVKNISAYSTGLDSWIAQAEAVRDIGGSAEAYFNSAAEAIGAFDIDNLMSIDSKVTAIGKELKDQANKVGSGGTKPGTVEDTYKSSDYDVTYSKSLLGNIVYQFVAPSSNQRGTVLGRLEQIRLSRINPVSTLGKNKDVETDVEFATADLADLTKALEKTEKILDAVEKVKRGSVVEKAEKARDKLKTASDKADAQYQKAVKGDKASADQLATFKALLSLNQSATNFFIAPTTSIAQNSLTVVRTTLALVAKNLTAYKKA